MNFELNHYDGGAAVSLSDTTAVAFDALYVGVVGNVKVDMKNGAALTFVAVPAGTVLKVRVVKVYSTGTTASSIVGLIGAL